MPFRLLASIAVAIALALCCTATASADDLTSDDYDALTQAAYDGGASGEIPGLACLALCEDLRIAEQRPMIDGPAERALAAQRVQLAQRTGLLPKLAQMGRFVRGRGFQIGEAFYVGWEIGTAIRKKWLGGTGLPDPQGGNQTVVGAELVEAGRYIIGTSGPYGSIEIRAPALGWLAETPGGYRAVATIQDFNPGQLPYCTPWSDIPISAGDWPRLTSGVYAYPVDCGTHVFHHEALFKSLDWWRSDGTGPGATEDWAGQPTTQPSIPNWAGEPWSWGGLRGQVEGEVGGNPGDFGTLRDKTAYELGKPGACDPIEPFVCNTSTVSRATQKKCDLGSGGQGDPDPGPQRPKNDPANFVVHTGPLVRRAEGEDELVTTSLKVGWNVASSNPEVEWKGWGWRHIRAKHGWTDDDIEATEQALRNPPERYRSTGLRYVGTEYDGVDDVRCRRVVFVYPEKAGGQPEAPEITSSYGEVVP